MPEIELGTFESAGTHSARAEGGSASATGDTTMAWGWLSKGLAQQAAEARGHRILTSNRARLRIVLVVAQSIHSFQKFLIQITECLREASTGVKY